MVKIWQVISTVVQNMKIAIFCCNLYILQSILECLNYQKDYVIFFIFQFGCPTFVIGPLLWQQAPTSNINHCVLTICNLKFVNQVECLVGFEPELRTFQFDHNILIHLATLPKWKKISSRWLFNFFGFLDFLFEHILLLNKARKNCIQMWSNIFYWKISIYMLFEIVKF